MNKYERLVKLRSENSFDDLAEKVIALEDQCTARAEWGIKLAKVEADNARLRAALPRPLEPVLSASDAVNDIAEWREGMSIYELLETELSKLRDKTQRLEADNARLTAALLEIERQATAWKPPRYSWFGETARAALNGEKE